MNVSGVALLAGTESDLPRASGLKPRVSLTPPTHAFPDDDDLLNAREIRRMFANVSDMTIWRWTHSEQIAFPKPVQIGRRNYWRRGDVRRWREERLGAA
jgi:predicted DNA-binding transcriptional regulator AlpA